MRNFSDKIYFFFNILKNQIDKLIVFPNLILSITNKYFNLQPPFKKNKLYFQTYNEKRLKSIFFLTTENYFKFIFSKIKLKISEFLSFLIQIIKTSYTEGFLYIKGLFIVFFFDALIIDDEPL